ncbi:hypothetical protein GTY75_07690 [Streptomyces sp. SID8381]|nr:hypothetical protein [Streptomyces sp. SID8381]
MLPSDGGQPLLPGMTGGGASGHGGHGGQGGHGGHGGHGAPGGMPPAQQGGQGPGTAPAGGQAWGQPWGPGQQQSPQPPQPGEHGQPGQPGQGWQGQAPAQTWGAPYHQQPQGRQPQGHQAQGHQAQGQQPQGQWDPHGQTAGHPGAGPLPPEGAPAPGHGAHGGAQPPYQQHQPQAGHPRQAHGTHGAPLPPAAPYGAAGADEGATQYIPPVTDGPAPYAPPADEGATQYIPPVGAGAMPPEAPGGDPATRFLGRVPQGGGAGGGNPDAEPTQFMAPVPAGPAGGGPGAPFGAGPGAGGPGDAGRQTPAEFDNLFRGGGEAPATAQLPRVEPRHDARPAPAGYPGPGGYAGPGAPYGGQPGGPGQDDDGGRGGKRTGSRLPLIAAVGVGIAVLGVGAGALLSGGGDDDKKTDASANVSATAPASNEPSASPTADPARDQAVALDKLLADSGSSRASVIKAVADVKKCANLHQAAADLRAAAKQRGELVTRLNGLSVDKLPNHAQLTGALTSAWKASASADQHYAAWADQVGGKNGCKKGQARTTSQAQAGNRQSGVASAQKSKAAGLWNAIAGKYGLTQRQPTQL